MRLQSIPARLPWTIEPDGVTFLIRDASGRIVAEVVTRQDAEQIVIAVMHARRVDA